MSKVPTKHRVLKKSKLVIRPIALAISLAFFKPVAVHSAVITCTTEVTNNLDTYPTSTPGSLRAAIECANFLSGINTININLPANSVITLAPAAPPDLNNFLEIHDDVIIKGPTAGDPASVTIQGNNNRIIRSSNADLTLENMTLTSGDTTSNGGAIYFYKDPYTDASYLTLNDTVVIGNSADGNGGGIAFKSEESTYSSTFYTHNEGIILNRSSITNNSADGSGGGGGIYFSNYFGKKGYITLNQSSVNSNLANDGAGGGVFSGSYYGGVTLNNQSSISSNQTKGIRNLGGGIFSKSDVTLNESRVSSNSTVGFRSRGGGIATAGEFSGTITLNKSTISGNTTGALDTDLGVIFGDDSDGGGIFARNWNVILKDSTVSGNATLGADSHGGGIFASSIQAIQSTISGNTVTGANSRAGGIYINDYLYDGSGSGLPLPTIIQSTITNNTSTTGAGGAYVYAVPYTSGLTIKNSIISGNSGLNIIVYGSYGAYFSSHNNLIGDPDIGGYSLTATTYSFISNNIVNNNPDLSSLSNNGGLTLTHEPNASSPALDKGDNAEAPYNNAPSTVRTDQRGGPRIRNSTVDIGSVERQATPAAVCYPTYPS